MQESTDSKPLLPKRKSLEDMSKEELLLVIRKMRESVVQMASEKKVAEELFNQAYAEKKEMELRLQKETSSKNISGKFIF